MDANTSEQRKMLESKGWPTLSPQAKPGQNNHQEIP